VPVESNPEKIKTSPNLSSVQMSWNQTLHETVVSIQATKEGKLHLP